MPFIHIHHHPVHTGHAHIHAPTTTHHPTANHFHVNGPHITHNPQEICANTGASYDLNNTNTINVNNTTCVGINPVHAHITTGINWTWRF